jgi:hypothetical protein
LFEASLVAPCAPAVTVAPGVPALPEMEYVAAGVVTVPVMVKLPAA